MTETSPVSPHAMTPARIAGWRKTASWIAVALLLLLAAAGLGLHAMLDTDHVKSMARDQVRAMWSRELAIGDLSLHLLPTPSLRARRVSLSNPPSAHNPSLLEADSVVIQVELLPLLHGQIALGKLAIDGMRLNLETLPDGSKSWNLKTSAQAPPPRPSRFDPTSLRAVQLHDLQVNYQNASAASAWHIDDLTGSAEAGGRNAIVDATGSRTTRATPTTQAMHPMHLHLQLADLSQLGEKNGSSEGAMQAEWGAAALTMAGRLPLSTDLHAAKLKLRFEAKSMADLFGFFDIHHGAVAPLSVVADLAENEGMLDIGQLGVQLGALHINGNARIAVAHPLRSFQATLAADRLDLAQTMQDAGFPRPPRKPEGEAFPLTPLAWWPLLLAMDGSAGKIDARIGWIKLRSGVELANTDAQLHFAKNRLDITHYAFDLLGGKASGQLGLDAHGKNARLNFAGHGMQLEKWFAQRGRKAPLVGGPTELHAVVTASGASFKDMAATLNGPVSIRVGPARILSAGAQEAEAILVGLMPFFSPADTDHVELACFSAVLPFSNGIARGQPIAGARSEASQWLGSGVLDLKRQTIDWRGRIAARSGVSLGVTNLSGDVRIGGRMNHPSIGMDPAGAPSALARLGAAIFTGGASLIATAVWDAKNQDTNPCQVVFAKNRAVADQAAGAIPAAPATEEKRRGKTGQMSR